MRQSLMVAMLLGVFFIGIPAKGTEFPAAGRGAAIYELLRSRGLLEDYLTEEVGRIAGTLVAAAGRWPGYGVNRPYAKDLINVYLVDSRRLPEKNILGDFGVELSGFSFRGNALAHEETGILFVDTMLLKSLVTASQLFANSGMDTAQAVGAIRARGIEAFRPLWDPNLNPTIRAAGYTDRWAMLSSGALAFILGHEMGHIALGADNSSMRRVPMRFKNKQDKDLYWACSDLIDRKYRRQQQIEKEADDYAVGLLGKVLFPDGVLTKPLLRYELGARWYIVYSLGQQLVDSLYATESNNVLAGVRMLMGPKIYQELIAVRPSSGKGSVQVFFPKAHPANVRRASDSLGRLAQSPYGFYYGQAPASETDIQVLEMLLSMECKNLRSRHGE